ncbi:MAG TPA: hypothetical protein VE544_06035 [Nitrososphaeraceae archaeon]|nr:hypothetical protein [Nitrososphaeraceae archaeon]
MSKSNMPSRLALAWIGRGNNDAVADAFLVRIRLLLLLASSILLVSFILVTTTAATSIAQEENDTAMVSSFPLKFSSLPIVDEVVINTDETPINETYTIVTFIRNGTMTVPDTGKTFNQTNHGYAIISPLAGSPGTLSSYRRETCI